MHFSRRPDRGSPAVVNFLARAGAARVPRRAHGSAPGMADEKHSNAFPNTAGIARPFSRTRQVHSLLHHKRRAIFSICSQVGWGCASKSMSKIEQSLHVSWFGVDGECRTSGEGRGGSIKCVVLLWGGRMWRQAGAGAEAPRGGLRRSRRPPGEGAQTRCSLRVWFAVQTRCLYGLPCRLAACMVCRADGARCVRLCAVGRSRRKL